MFYKKFLIVMALSLSALSILTVKSFSREDFVYQNKKTGVYVFEKDGIRCLTFKKIDGTFPLQGCLLLKDPLKLVFDYPKNMIASLLFNQSPKKILVLGLGVGMMPNVLSNLLPNTKIDIIEIDQEIAFVAKTYFNFNETENMKVIIADAYDFVLQTQEKYDIIFFDVFGEDYIPEKFLTRNFMQSLSKLLSPTGILAINTFTRSKTYNEESALVKDVFEDYYQISAPNRIIIVQNDKNANLDIEENALKMQKKLKKFDINAKDIASKIFHVK